MSTTAPDPPGATSAAPKPRPKIQRAPPLPPADTNYRRLRKTVHAVCFAIFVLLPFLDLMRFDIPGQRFYFLGRELWINEFAIIFLSLMFLMFVVVAMALVYGRIYCGYLCPQMIFSEASWEFEAKLKKWVSRRWPKWTPERRRLLERALFYSMVGIASVFLAFVFIAYFVPPADLLSRLLRFDLHTAGGIAGASVTVLTFLDFAFLRQKFCTTVCPYGYLQGMFVDKNTLLVHYRDPEKACIECGKCVRVCGMGIDIRDSPFQLECVHCGECVDACEDVLRRIGKPGLIHYAWGEQGELTRSKAEPWYRRLGFRDAKRVVIALLVLGYFAGLLVALSLRHSVLVQVRPERSRTLYDIGAAGEVSNTFHLRLANRSRKPAEVTLALAGLAGRFENLPPQPLSLAPGEVRDSEFRVVVRSGANLPPVLRFQLVANARPENATDRIDLTFLMPSPAERK